MQTCDKHGVIKDITPADPLAVIKPSEVEPPAAIAEVRWVDEDDH